MPAAYLDFQDLAVTSAMTLHLTGVSCTYLCNAAIFVMSTCTRRCIFKSAIAMPSFLLIAYTPKALAQSGFHVNKNLYSVTADSAREIDAAERVARHDHKRILLDFGGNWCG